jgi:hypothetical protein
MTTRLRLAALAALTILGACKPKSPPAISAALSLPSAVVWFRGVTNERGLVPNLPNPYHPYLAVANTHTDDIAVFDAVDDTLIAAPIPLHGLVYPLAGRPALLAAADLGDGLPDLLVAVSSGDSRLQLIRTWAPDGAVLASDDVDFGADAGIVAILALPPDPAAKGTARIVAALSGGRIGVASYARTSAEGGLAIAPTSHLTSGGLGFQPVDLAVIPGDLTRIWAATPDAIPPTNVHGVAEIAIAGTPVLTAAHDTIAPTRLVAAASLMERIPGSTALDQSAFPGQPTSTVKRVYAVLDESGCGFFAPIACGLVALDLTTGGLAMDPVLAGTIQAPIPLVPPVGLAASQPPSAPPDAADPIFAGTYLRIVTNISTRATTAAAGVASADGGLTFVDLGRWEVPSQQAIVPNVKATVTPVAAPGVPANQFLVLKNGASTVVSHVDLAGLTAAVGVTPGFTPTDRWTVTYQGVLPGLTSRRAQTGNDGTVWLAMQAPDGVSESVRLFDPVLGVHAGDTVVFDPNTVGTCPAFEAPITAFRAPDQSKWPGGAVELGTPTDPVFKQCLGLIAGTLNVRATIRAGGYVLVRGAAGAPLQLVGRPELDTRFDVASTDEGPLATACLLPPARAWPPSAADAASCVKDASLDPGGCRAACDALIRARLARRVSYLSEPTAVYTGPAISFTLTLEAPAATVPPSRDLALIMDTAEGRVPFRAFPTVGSAVGAAAVVPFDRSPYSAAQGIRFFVPYSSGIMIDATPTLPAASVVNTIH